MIHQGVQVQLIPHRILVQLRTGGNLWKEVTAGTSALLEIQI